MQQTSYYSELLRPTDPQNSLEETRFSYEFLKERHLQAMWLEQKYFKNLETVDGKPIQIISPGIWNAEAGPDFLKAHLIIGSQEIRGDIELHLFPEGWQQHKHHHDPRYNQVVLHLTYWKPKKKFDILTSKHEIITQSYFEGKLTIPESRLIKYIDLDLYPYKKFAGSGRCSNSLFQKLSDNQTIRLFRSAAAWRLQQKKFALEEKIENGEDHLAAGLAMVLGYKNNSEVFLSLYKILKSIPIHDEKQLLAQALGICGFFNDNYRKKWFFSSYYQSLAAIYDRPSQFKIDPLTLRLDKIRPANHPVRRLAILVKMMLDPSIRHLKNSYEALWQMHWQKGYEKKWIKLRQCFIDLLPAYRDPYWENHYLFEVEKQSRPIYLLGNDLKRDMLINIIFPFLYAKIEEKNNPDEINAFQHCYASFPASKTKKALYLTHRFFGDCNKDAFLLQADTQQGAYQIHRDFCMHYEASCLGCPFVDRYHAVFGS